MLKLGIAFLASASVLAGAAAAAPAPVASLRAEPVSRSEIRLNWRSVPAAARILVQRRDAQGAYADIATLAGGATEYVDRRLPSGVRQFYRVRNVDAAGVRGPARGAAGWTYTGPITITAGGVYSGAWESLAPDKPAVRIETAAPVVIEKSYIRSRGKGVEALAGEAELVVRDTRGIGLDPGVRNALRGCFIDIGLFRSFVMENNRAEGWGCGVRALNFGPSVQTRSDQIVRIRYNEFVNIDGRRSDGAGGPLIVLEPVGHAVQLNSLERADARIEWNEIVNAPGASRVEDVISPFQSGGRPGRPILIRNNYLQGGYHGDVAAQVDYTGQGINLGDCPDGDPDCAYVNAEGNVVVSYANGGIGILGGHHMRAFNNRVVSAQRAPNGVIIGGNFRTGYLYWNFYANPNWRENFLFNNYSFVADRDGRIAGDFLPDAQPALVFNNVNEGTPGAPPPRTLNTRVEAAELAAWRRRARAALVIVGPR
jgi:hypothetical protein